MEKTGKKVSHKLLIMAYRLIKLSLEIVFLLPILITKALANAVMYLVIVGDICLGNVLFSSSKGGDLLSRYTNFHITASSNGQLK